jgi:signal transduction histidine kinase
MSLSDLKLKNDFALHKLLIFVRIIGFIVIVSLIIGLWNFGLIDYNPLPILGMLIPIFLFLILLWYLLAKNEYLPENFLYFQFFAEYLLISVGIFYFGGFHKVFDLLYFLPVMSAMLVSLNLTAVSVVYAAIFYSAFSYLDIIYVHSGSITPDDILFISFFSAVFLIFVFQGYFLIKKIREQDKSLQRWKDDFLLRTIHDLRAPANTIRLIMEKYGSPEWLAANPGTKEDVEMVRDADAQIMNLLKDVLNAVKGEQLVNYSKEKVNINVLISGIIKELSPLILEKDLKVELPEGGYFAFGDPEKLWEVFVNIFDNAIKYNRGGGKISVAYNEKGNMLEINVADTGIGMSKENLGKIFTPYFRGDAPRGTVGTGLGLYIVKQLVEGMGGKAAIYSNLGEGTEVVVSLPAAK